MEVNFSRRFHFHSSHGSPAGAYPHHEIHHRVRDRRPKVDLQRSGSSGGNDAVTVVNVVAVTGSRTRTLGGRARTLAASSPCIRSPTPRLIANVVLLGTVRGSLVQPVVAMWLALVLRPAA